MRDAEGETNPSDLERELRLIDDLEDWARAELLGVRAGGWRAEATTAVAASAAEETYRLTDQLPEWQNETSAAWRGHLARVWELLQRDDSQYYALSHAVADFLTSPLNHNEGQDGPDDFDRPQTVASYSAVLSAVAWGVDFALTAIRQIFDAIDLEYEYGTGESEERRSDEDRWAEVQREAEFVRRVVTTVVEAKRDGGLGYTPDVLTSIKS
jgi:hypothetical protein